LGYARPARHHGSGRDVRINRQAATYRNRNAVANNRATSVYGCWWRFLKANTAEYPPPNTLPHDDPRQQLAERFGDLCWKFPEWWGERGQALFTEQKPNPFIRLLEPERHEPGAPTPEYLVVKIPMTMRRERILSQLRVLLEYPYG
jgi:hypothetical protein